MNMKPQEVSRFIEAHLRHCTTVNASVLNTLRILKGVNPGDTYYDSYIGHYKKYGDKFVDYYHLLWFIGSHLPLKNIMEIGCRTGGSICQLLSAITEYKDLRVVLFDIFNDGYISPEIVKINLHHLNLPDYFVYFIVGDSKKTVLQYKKDLPNSKFDYILVDGDHEKKNARIDLENIIEMLTPGGILIMDDLTTDGCDMKDVWEGFKKDHPEEFFWYENYEGKGVGIGVKK